MQAQRRGLPTWAWVTVVVVAAVVLGAVAGLVGGAVGFLLARQAPDQQITRVPSVVAPDSPRGEGTVAAIAESALPGVVSIAVDGSSGSGTGSGFVLREDGYIVTNNHVIAGAAGHAPVTTHVFVEGSPYLDSDTVFGVKESLVRPVQTVDDPARAEQYGVANPFLLLEFDVVLDPQPAGEEDR